MYREIKPEEVGIANGYAYFSDKNHPLANGYVVYLHRHIMSIHLGRWLDTEETVHHKDGNKLNNDISNLEILSRKEHAALHQEGRRLPDKVCIKCGILFHPNTLDQKYCSRTCAHTKLDSLTKEELEALIWEFPYTQLGKVFNCSDNAIKKWALRLGCNMPPRLFHSKFRTEEAKIAEFNRIEALR